MAVALRFDFSCLLTKNILECILPELNLNLLILVLMPLLIFKVMVFKVMVMSEWQKSKDSFLSFQLMIILLNHFCILQVLGSAQTTLRYPIHYG